MLRAIFTALCDVLVLDRVSIVLVDARGSAASAAVFSPTTSSFVRHVPASRNVQRVLDSAEPLINDDVTACDASSRELVEAGFRSTLIVPLIAGDRAMGTINIGSTRPAAYGDDDIDKAMDVAARFSAALSSAQRFGAERRDSEPLAEGPALSDDASPVRGAPFLFRPERVLDQMSEALLIDDVDGRVVFVNEAFRVLFGIAEQDLSSIVLEDYVAPEWRAVLRQRHDDRIRGKEVPRDFEYVGVHRDGTRLDLEVSVVPVVEHGATLGTQSVIRDVSERRALARRAAHAQKMEALGQLAGGVAHDFNNLLNVMVLYPQIIREQLAENASVEVELGELELAAERAVMLTRQLLTFSRRQDVQKERVDVGDAIAALVPMLRRVMGGHITIRYEPPSDQFIVSIDPGQLEQIVVNLVINARDAGATEIEVGLERLMVDAASARELNVGPGGYAVVAVSDDGQGMTPEVIAKAFQPFFTTKPVGEGTGLGLATVRGIAEACGGAVGVDSAPSIGTTFRLYLPALESSA